MPVYDLQTYENILKTLKTLDNEPQVVSDKRSKMSILTPEDAINSRRQIASKYSSEKPTSHSKLFAALKSDLQLPEQEPVSNSMIKP